MKIPARNMVEIVDLSPSDALLPILECVSNSVLSLDQSGIPVKERNIDVEIVRGEPQQAGLFGGGIKPIKDVIVTDNGIGFNDKNLESFETPHSNILRQKYGCLGVGRFTVLAVFQKMKIRSNYSVNGHWKYRELDFDVENEVRIGADQDSDERISKTVVEIQEFSDEAMLEKTAVSVEVIAREMMEHFLIFYLSDNLPNITVFESDSTAKQNVNELYQDVSKENEAAFQVKDQDFKLYITRNPKTTSRKNHYVRYCADSRVVGRGKSLGSIDDIFNYPLTNQSGESFLDVFVVSEYLNKNKMPTRNAWRIPAVQEDRLHDEITFQDIEQGLVKILRKEYSEHVKRTQERNVSEWKAYMTANPRFNSLLEDDEVLKSLPANSPDDKKEEILHRIVYKRQKTIDETIQEFITTKQVNEESIQELVKEIRSKAILDKDSLTDYMLRRKAVLDLFDKFLEADRKGDYKLEKDIHNLIFPMGGTSENTNYEAHHLWLLDERLVSFQFIASDKAIGSYCDVVSRKEADLVLLADPPMFDNPIGFGDKNHGDLNALVIFEFKRPGETASNKNSDDHWEFNDLTDKYFDAFRYGDRRTNYKGRIVTVADTTPKFGYIVLDYIPNELAAFNITKGWNKTPFGTYYKIVPGSNMHLETMTFTNLIDAAKQRHNPFFDRLFLSVDRAAAKS
jgi:hypothetical protein